MEEFTDDALGSELPTQCSCQPAFARYLTAAVCRSVLSVAAPDLVLMLDSLNLPAAPSEPLTAFFSLLSVSLSLPVVLSLTERAQLLKNVFKKSTVNLYRSESMQQNLLRKRRHFVFCVSVCLERPPLPPHWPVDFHLIRSGFIFSQMFSPLRWRGEVGKYGAP